jgi:hypothetical protein
MNRRTLLQIKPETTTSPKIDESPRGLLSGLSPFAAPLGISEIVHLLKRTQFGASVASIEIFKSLSLDQAIEKLLNPASLNPPPPLKNYDNTSIPTTDQDYVLPMGSTWVNTYSADGTVNAKRMSSLKASWLGLMLNQDNSILEKMTLFWHNHFATETADYGRATFGFKYLNLLRKFALGNFKQFVKEMTIEIAMLRYLNGYLNTATAPDENYGRELQELFTLGKDNNPNFTEDDVKAAARILTGWSINFTTETVSFTSSKHDKTSKQFSSFYSNALIAGRADNAAGDTELNDLINLIFSKKKEVSEFIVRKLYRWFCYYSIDSETEKNVIQPLAQLFVNSNWEIKPVLSALLKSEHFFDPLNRGCIIKNPLDFLVGMCREFNISFPLSSDYVNSYNMWSYIRSLASNLQMDIGDPPNVSGWPAYYQLPLYYRLWINSDTLPKRNRYTDTLVNTGYTQNSKKIMIDPIAFTKSLSNPSDPNILINDSLQLLLSLTLSETSKQIIKKQILLSNQLQDHYWTDAWNAHINNPTDTAAFNIVNTRLKSLYSYFMKLPEYQLN